MKTPYLLLLVIGCSSYAGAVFSAEKPICDTKLFSCYEERVKDCTSKDAPWANGPDLGAVTVGYVAFTSEAYTSVMTKITDAQKTPSEKTRVETEIQALKARETDGYRAAELVGIQYRANMNNIFSCATIAARWDKLQKLEDAIKKKNKGTDIMKKLEKEKKRYETLMSTKNCLQNGTNKATDKVVDRLTVSATTEYCKYTVYLDYLEANIDTDYTKALEMDKKIAGQSGGSNPISSDDALRKFTTRTNAIKSERNRAQETLPKAVIAFQEMDRTYVTHLLLVIIYDDYLKLREQLNTYLSLISQTFEKAYNAQDANQR